MKTMNLISVSSAVVALLMAGVAGASDIACNDGAGSTLELVRNPDQDSLADTLILIEGPAVDYLFPAESREFIARRYGLNSQDYRFNGEGKFALFARHGTDPNFPEVLASKGGRYEPQTLVKRDHTGLKVTDLHHDWYFGTCN